MKVKIEININPFAVPNFVIPAFKAFDCDTEVGLASMPPSALDENTLNRLCSDFRSAVLKKAGKEQPATAF